DFYRDASYELVQEITAFDEEKNPRTAIVNQNEESYIWDGDYMLAKVSNATHDQIAFTSFESSQKGNWTYGGPPADMSAITGKRAYSLSGGSLSISSIDNIPYIVSYWSKDGAQNVNSTSYITGRTLGDWTYFEHAVTPSTGSVTISGSGTVDEVRLYPEDAQMTTFTYKNLRGVSSICDVSSRIVYYEYGVVNNLRV